MDIILYGYPYKLYGYLKVCSKSHLLTPPGLRERAKRRKPACCRKALIQQNS